MNQLFNVLLVFGLTALNAIVPLQRNDVQKFPIYTIESGNILTDNQTTILVQIKDLNDTTLRFQPDIDGNLTIFPDLNSLNWQISESYDTGFDVGSEQYVNFGFFDFQAAVLYVYKQVNIAPSYWHLYECQPRYDENGTGIFSASGTTVSDWSKITFIPGVVDEVCYGNQRSSQSFDCKTSNTTCQFGADTIADHTYGNDLLIAQGSKLDAAGLKLRIANFGPVYDIANWRVFYGWDDEDFLYLKRYNGGFGKGQESNIAINDYIVAYQPIDCSTEIEETTSAEECQCPEPTDAAYSTDPRTQLGGICYVEPDDPSPDDPSPDDPLPDDPLPDDPLPLDGSGYTRAAWTIIVVVLLLPLLSMW
ncbi:MAG: hypothetical protein EZS28_000502 [Streblomastix strix]|uniref:Uncharacterized protein n=1 Tax=Streblomastix strix TaxID=222440 RepID=A0A5J4XAZ1_9EUKA|nr:MAG: hypothetical protein EZS28_000502 [Streblomastix strix]